MAGYGIAPPSSMYNINAPRSKLETYGFGASTGASPAAPAPVAPTATGGFGGSMPAAAPTAARKPVPTAQWGGAPAPSPVQQQQQPQPQALAPAPVRAAAAPAPTAAPAASLSAAAIPQSLLNSLQSFMIQGPQYQPAATPAPVQNTAQTDPRLEEHLGKVRQRVDDPEGNVRLAQRQATSEIRDATEGRKKALRGMLAGRGSTLSHSSVGELGERALLEDEGRQVSKSASDIALKRAEANDSFLLNAGNAYAAPGQAARADRSLAQNEWQAVQGDARAKDQLALSSWLGTLNATTSLLGRL